MEDTEVIQLLHKDCKVTMHKYDAGSLQRYLVRIKINMMERTRQSLVDAYIIETMIKNITDKVYKSTYNNNPKVGLTFNLSQYIMLNSLFASWPPAANLLPLDLQIKEHVRKHSLL